MGKSVQFIKYTNSQILVRFEGVSRNIEGDPANIQKIFKACADVQKDPTEDNKDYLKGLLNPIAKREFTDRLDIDDNGDIYLKGTQESMPEGLKDLVVTYMDNDVSVDSLVNFWELCLANPNETARDGFYNYIKDFGVVITDNGYAILYKAVNTVNAKDGTDPTMDVSLSQYVSNQYLRIKKMKKSPKNYQVYSVFSNETLEYRYEISMHESKEPNIGEEDVIEEDHGLLSDLYKQIIEEGKKMVESDERVTIYEPWHVGDYGMEIRMGQPITMPREQCDPDINVDCSYGLHVGSHRYVSTFGRGMGAILAVLINPADVVALPQYDHSKIRVCRYFPYAEIERDELGYWEEIEEGYFEEDFMAHEAEEVKKALEELYTKKAEGAEIDEEEEAYLNKRLIILENHS